jgi:cysteine-rich repeat protein
MKRFLALALASMFALIPVAGCGHGAGNGGDDDDTMGDGGIPPGCGDGMINGAEECDDGNTMDGDGCSHACMLENGHTASCGDGILEVGEGCDDGNMVSGDGCSSVCQSESAGLPCTPHTFRCGPSGDVEVCNNAGTAWQYVSSCSTGCNAGACTDPTCQAGTKRCHGEVVETCNAGGTGWDAGEDCSATYCASGTCALPGLDVGTNSTYEGEVIVAGNFTVDANSTLTSSTGDLTIIADNITVAAGSAIAIAPKGVDPRGATCYNYPYTQIYTANYGGVPTGQSGYYYAPVYGGDFDAAAEQGSPGAAGNTYFCNNPTGTPVTHGGGRLRLIAKHDVTIAGQLLAAGENGTSISGGSGGGIQIAGDTIEITGSISTAGGTYSTTPAGLGRVRLLYGKTLTTTGTVIGKLTTGRRPPIDLTSPTQPDPTLVYNDDFTTLSIAHERAFDDAQGYIHVISQTEYQPPQPADGVFSATESFDVVAKAFFPGDNWVHLASIDADSALSPVESRFHVKINATAPTASSTSHTSPTVWYPNSNPYFAWTLPTPDASVKRVHYVFDHFGDTLPKVADTALATSQKQLLVSNVADGIWVLHVIAEDTQGHLTKKAAHVVVRIGADPGTGTVFGSVFDNANHPVPNAIVRVNRGLFTATTNAQGSYTITGVAAGTWEISVLDQNTGPQTLTVTANNQASANFTVLP